MEEAACDAELGRLSSRELRALDDEYMSAGCGHALRLLASPSAEALYRCHCEGGVLVGIDEGCVLLSRRAV